MAVLRRTNKMAELYSSTAMQPLGQSMIQWSLDSRRLIILGKRIAAGTLIGSGAPDTVEQKAFTDFQNELKEKHLGAITEKNTSEHTNFALNNSRAGLNDYVAIINLDAKRKNQGYEPIYLPFIPRELEYNIDSTFAAIKPIARNSAKYHYTGSEDKLEFEIDWHSFDEGRKDVITNCRKVEALSKGDGYNNPPPEVILQWGGNDVLFRDHIFVVLSASFRLVQFNKGQMKKDKTIVRTDMMPVQAYQKVTLARVSSYNLSRADIQRVH